MIEQKFRDVVVSREAGSTFSGQLGISTMQAGISASRNQRANDWKKAGTRSQCQRDFKRIVIAVNVRVGAGLQKNLD